MTMRGGTGRFGERRMLQISAAIGDQPESSCHRAACKPGAVIGLLAQPIFQNHLRRDRVELVRIVSRFRACIGFAELRRSSWNSTVRPKRPARRRPNFRARGASSPSLPSRFSGNPPRRRRASIPR